MNRPLEIYEIDINKSYIIDEDMQVFRNNEHYEYYLTEDNIDEYTGIKDNIENYIEEKYEYNDLAELKGSEIIAMLYKEEVEMKEYYKEKYYNLMEGK